MYIGRKCSIAARCVRLPASSRVQRQCERSATVIHPSSATGKPNPPLQLLNVSKSLFILHSSSSFFIFFFSFSFFFFFSFFFSKMVSFLGWFQGWPPRGLAQRSASIWIFTVVCFTYRIWGGRCGERGRSCRDRGGCGRRRGCPDCALRCRPTRHRPIVSSFDQLQQLSIVLIIGSDETANNYHAELIGPWFRVAHLPLAVNRRSSH